MDKYCHGFVPVLKVRPVHAHGGRAIATQVRVPKSGGMNTTKVNVVRWLKREGEFVKLREPLVELETEKVSYELDSPAEGVLLRIVSPEAAEVPVGEILCDIGRRDEPAASS